MNLDPKVRGIWATILGTLEVRLSVWCRHVRIQSRVDGFVAEIVGHTEIPMTWGLLRLGSSLIS